MNRLLQTSRQRHPAAAGMLAPYCELDSAEHWFLGISPEGIGTLGMLLNFAVALTVSRCTKAPPLRILELVERIRLPEPKQGSAR